MIRRSSLAALAAPAAVALAVAGCGGSGSTNTSTSATAPQTSSGKAATVGLASEGSLGQTLVDSTGRTLYLFQKDSRDKSACAGACAASWPPLRDSGKPVAGTGLNASLLGTIKRSDGKAQVTYNGHPLYLFSGDQAAGDTNGQGVNAFGASWFVLSASGSLVQGTGTNSNGSNGY
jgi:predicted lipoprotein with Yx(FWY)xxD motif